MSFRHSEWCGTCIYRLHVNKCDHAIILNMYRHFLSFLARPINIYIIRFRDGDSKSNCGIEIKTKCISFPYAARDLSFEDLAQSPRKQKRITFNRGNLCFIWKCLLATLKRKQQNVIDRYKRAKMRKHENANYFYMFTRKFSLGQLHNVINQRLPGTFLVKSKEYFLHFITKLQVLRLLLRI